MLIVLVVALEASSIVGIPKLMMFPWDFLAMLLIFGYYINVSSLLYSCAVAVWKERLCLSVYLP
jgi:hypothetical protein